MGTFMLYALRHGAFFVFQGGAMIELIDKLHDTHTLSRQEWKVLIDGRDEETAKYLFEKARQVRHAIYGKDIYIRGLIEVSNHCRNDCYYCGIRRSNKNVERYRLTPEEILTCVELGYELGFRTFVFQGGEDPYYTDDLLCNLIHTIKEKHPDCAVTLSLGERESGSYQRLYEAGGDRYLLRHETASSEHYDKLHPSDLKLKNRQDCLSVLKETGFQTGSGFMVGSPFQTVDHLVDDILYLKELNPQMVGIGPFIPHHDTPFASYPPGSVDLTLYLLGLIRLMLPKVLLPATTALGTLDPIGRQKGILAGANVVMPNLSPPANRKKYALYDNKLATGCEAAEHLTRLNDEFEQIGYHVVVSRGDYHSDTDQ